MEKLKQTISQQDEELAKLRSEVKKVRSQKVTSPDPAMDRASARGIIAEINDECKRTAGIVGSHRKING